MALSTAAAQLRPAVAALTRRQGIDAVHRVRTQARRLDALLRARAREDAASVATARRRLDDFRHRLGALRDVDEIARRLQAESKALDPAERRAFRPLIGACRAEQQAGRRELLRWLRSPARRALDAQLRRLAAGEVAEATPADLARTLAHWRRRARRLARELRRDSPLDDYHHLRRVTRRLLDLLHELRAVAPREAAAAADAIQPLRAGLGTLQDARIAEAWLRQRVRRRLDPAAAFQAGRLSVALELDCAEARSRARKARDRLSDRSLGRVVRALRD